MNIRVCYGCPLRLVGVPGNIHPKRCSILQAKLRGVKGLGLASIDFKCPTKLALFAPGQCVTFMGADPDGGYGVFEGYVYKWDSNKVRVVSEETDKPFCRIRPDRLSLVPGKERRVCVHCGLPEGVRIKVKMADDPEPREWVCRMDYAEAWPHGETPIPCEYQNSDLPADGDGKYLYVDSVAGEGRKDA